jgi:putative phosphoribosyl transferase
LSPRNVAVADRLNGPGLATLLLDLLTPREAADRARAFDIELLATRLVAAAGWVRSQPELAERPLAFFGASTGAAAALVAAAALGDDVAAVVSRGGRPDLAGDALKQVRAPTLLIVGGEDPHVLELNRAAARKVRAETRIVVIPGAGHLFEEHGALERVAGLAAEWIAEHLVPAPSRR